MPLAACCFHACSTRMSPLAGWEKKPPMRNPQCEIPDAKWQMRNATDSRLFQCVCYKDVAPSGAGKKALIAKWQMRNATGPVAGRQSQRYTPAEAHVLPVQRPASAVGAAQQLVRFRTIAAQASGPIIVNLLADAVSHQSKEHHLDHFAAV